MRPNLGITEQASEVLQWLLERSGILREPAPDLIDFLHRSLQDYLCARAVVDASGIGFLLARANDDQWREVIVLSAGLAQQQQLIMGLIKRGDKGRSNQHRLYLLAVACRETVGKIEGVIRNELSNCLAAIVPPKNEEEAWAIASARELAISYLRYSPAYSAAEAAACVKALGQMGARRRW